MSSGLSIEQIDAIQGSAVVLLYRAAKADGSLILQADVESLTVHSQDTTNDGSAGTQDYAAADAIFDTLQRDARWNKDAIGYNVALIVPATLLPDGDTVYQLDVRIAFVGGETDQLRPFEVATQKVYGAD